MIEISSPGGLIMSVLRIHWSVSIYQSSVSLPPSSIPTDISFRFDRSRCFRILKFLRLRDGQQIPKLQHHLNRSDSSQSFGGTHFVLPRRHGLSELRSNSLFSPISFDQITHRLLSLFHGNSSFGPQSFKSLPATLPFGLFLFFLLLPSICP